MPKVKNLALKLQTGTDSTYFATWEFDTSVGSKVPSASAGSHSVKAGDLVSIKPGSTYYNGVAIPDWVMADRWYVRYLSGDRAVIDRNADGSNSIMSPVNVANLVAAAAVAAVSAQSDEPADKSTLDHYKVDWYYDTGDNVWFEGGSSDTASEQATYSAPSNAVRVKVVVTPVSKTHKVNDQDVSYWTGTSVPAILSTDSNPPSKPSTPTVEIDKYRLTASLENISDAKADQIRFEVYSGTSLFATGTVTVLTRQASWSCAVEAGGLYRVRCAAVNLLGGTQVMGEYSDYSSATGTIPSAPTRIVSCKASSETAVHLEWSAVGSAETYDIEYTTKVEYFDGSNETTVVSGVESPHYELTGLGSGEEYFFRVRAANDLGTSGWSPIASVVVGKTPTAPTTWSSTSTAISGERLVLYWVHNSRDSSSQTFAELELTVDGRTTSRTIRNENTGDDIDRTSFYEVDTSGYVEGTAILWRVRTAGVTRQYGEWSAQRRVDVYAPPTITLSLTDSSSAKVSTVRAFPAYISALTGPKTQSPIGYHVAVVADDSYTTLDSVGNLKMVNAGEEVYSSYVDASEPLLLELNPGNVDLENGASYTVRVTAAMDSGLSVEGSIGFDVLWRDEAYEPEAEVGIDSDSLSAYIRPFCLDADGEPVSGITIAVYRRDFDGGFTEVASGIDPSRNSFVVDPHPALDYARYRVVATSLDTGAVSYSDLPPYPVGSPYVVIQWDEAWSEFGEGSGDVLEQRPWTGSMLKILYNVDVTDNSEPEVTLVEYAGREHPVSYYGTQHGSKSSWSMVITKEDKDLLYALRRLSRWMGDAYVREPYGSGYWAHVTVSISQKHNDEVVPVSISLTRVEGGV